MRGRVDDLAEMVAVVPMLGELIFVRLHKAAGRILGLHRRTRIIGLSWEAQASKGD